MNPEIDEPPPKLDEKDEMPTLKSHTNLKLGASEIIRDVACRLVATCFYFDVQRELKENVQGEFEVQGRFLSVLSSNNVRSPVKLTSEKAISIAGSSWALR